MSNNYEDYSSPIQRNGEGGGKNGGLTALRILVVVIVALAVILSAYSFIKTHNDESNGKNDVPAIPATERETLPPEPKDTEPPATEPETEPVSQTEEPVFETLTVQKYYYQTHTGSVILVNNVYPYVFDLAENKSHVNIYANMRTDFKDVPNPFKVSDTTLLVQSEAYNSLKEMMSELYSATGSGNVIIRYAYRTLEEQQQVYDAYVKKHGEKEAETAVSKPGSSDFHTALSVSMKIYDGKTTYPISSGEEYKWLLDNCKRFGFVVRYPAGKTEITGIDYDNGSELCLRYVGKVHACAMEQTGKCLEEYALGLVDYTFDGEHLTVEVGDKTWGIYYVPAPAPGEGENENKTVDVPVPKNESYLISGNNAGGFIVAYEKG